MLKRMFNRVLFLSLSALFLGLFVFLEANAQSFKFAHLSDTHIGNATAAEDLRRTVNDINQQKVVEFVVISGDITEFGSDEELRLAKQILDSLAVKYYIVPGNHDTNWSESGGNTFKRVFGAETFSFKYGGYHFIGTNSGPNMRMSPGQIPRENLVWLDSLFAAETDVNMPVISMNHYPLDSDLNNWNELIDRLKTRNVVLTLCGHGHSNKRFETEGIPAIMGRSNLRAKDAVGGYNIATVNNGEITYQERTPGKETKKPWTSAKLENHHFKKEGKTYPRPDYSVNKEFPHVQVKWTFQDDSDIGAGMVQYQNSVITANTAGDIYALDLDNGLKLWSFSTGGKIYSTPEVWNDYVIVGSSDHYIYCLNANSGKLNWKLKTNKAVLGSPVVKKGMVYIGGSDGTFRGINIKTGKQKWSFNQVAGFVSSKPLIYQKTLYFGSWDNGFYALNSVNGKSKWDWTSGARNRMFSPAAVYPVGVNDRIFIVAPDRYMTALNSKTGEVVWREHKEGIRARESMGLSVDGSKVYIKTMDGELLGVSTSSDEMEIVWRSKLQLPYELTPSAIVSVGNSVFVPNHNGLISAVNAETGQVEWQHKISNAMINPILALDTKRIIASSMDGKIVFLNKVD